MALPDPGPSWHIITTGDFNHDGKADIVWQNADGMPAIWLMSGTTPTNEFTLPNPTVTDLAPAGSAAQSIAFHLGAPDRAAAGTSPFDSVLQPPEQTHLPLPAT